MRALTRNLHNGNDGIEAKWEHKPCAFGTVVIRCARDALHVPPSARRPRRRCARTCPHGGCAALLSASPRPQPVPTPSCPPPPPPVLCSLLCLGGPARGPRRCSARGRGLSEGFPGRRPRGGLTLSGVRSPGQDVCLSCLRPGLPGTGHRAGATKTSGSRVSPDMPGCPRSAAAFGPIC